MKTLSHIASVLLLIACALLAPQAQAGTKAAARADGKAGGQLKVLCIGNSFSIDAVESNLVQLAAERGVDLTVGNLYIGGCSLERHARNIRRDSAAYSFRLMRQNPKANAAEAERFERIVTDSVSILQALQSDSWDIITMQQASHYSGQWFTYEPYLSELIDSVRLHIAPTTRIYWYMTWAYQQDAKHPSFVPKYNGDQAYMYSEIVGCNRQVLRSHDFDGFIPGGAAVQQARRTKLGDTFCRDGYHLNYTYGRYLMACLWLEVISGKSAVGCKYMPEGMTVEQRKIVQRVAHKVARKGRKTLKE